MHTMRSVGMSLAVVLFAAVILQAQPPAVPGLAPAAPASDPVLDAHLAGWEKVMGRASNFSAKFDLTKTEPVFKKERKYSGSVLCMKPNLARLSMWSATDKNDFDAYICNGKSIFEYHWKEKTITEIPLAAGAGAGENLMLDFLGGMTAEAAKKRFQIAQHDPKDKYYVYLDIKPILPKDKEEFEFIRLALYAPGIPPPYIAYLPAMMMIKKGSGENSNQEMWTFKEENLDVKGIGPQVFQFEEPKDKGWQLRRAPINPMPAAPPGPGGVVRPNVPQR
ncbi:MAG TPA: TIGR03009 domain-containing protein [Urbifossiella sp.]